MVPSSESRSPSGVGLRSCLEAILPASRSRSGRSNLAGSSLGSSWVKRPGCKSVNDSSLCCSHHVPWYSPVILAPFQAVTLRRPPEVAAIASELVLSACYRPGDRTPAGSCLIATCRVGRIFVRSSHPCNRVPYREGPSRRRSLRDLRLSWLQHSDPDLCDAHNDC